jgi:amino acid adenylation domain-containing protein
MDQYDLGERIANLSPAKRTLLEQRLKGSGVDALVGRTIPRRAAGEFAPISFAQQRLWFLNQLDPKSPVYNEPRVIRITGLLDVEALEKTLNHIIERHEVLRTTVVLVDGNPMQQIADRRTIELPVVDLRTHNVQDRDTEAHRLIDETIRRPFDLSNDLMLRVLVLRLADHQHILVVVKHHIASDGWSSGIFWREVATLYAAYTSGQTAELPELPVQYADYAEWQREWLQGDVLETQLSYWRKQLDNLTTLRLPTDRPRPAIQSFQGARQALVLSNDLSQALKALSRKEGVTLFMTLLAAFQALLYRYTGQEDITVGSLIAGRNRSEIEGLIGFFVNTLVLRTDVSGNLTFKELLERVRGVCVGAYSHQDLPFEKLVEELQPERNLNSNPLFQVVFQLNSGPRTVLTLTGIKVEDMESDSGISKFDLSMAMADNGEEIIGRLQYNTDLFDSSTIERMLDHFKTLLEGIAADPEPRISELPLLTEPEKHRLLVEWNDTKAGYPKDKCIHRLFEEQVERTPEAIAIVFEDQQLTYQQLNARANQLAHYLQKLGVGPEVLVGICIERSIEMVVGLLGVLKAGGAYVPLDPTYPKERLGFMLDDSKVFVLLTQEKLKAETSHSVAVYLDRNWQEIARESVRNPESAVSAENLAYVIYTSGSTGAPKGVVITHQALCNHMLWMQSTYPLFDTDCVLQKTPFSFDASVWEFYAPLLVGAKLVLAPPDAHHDIGHLVTLIAGQQVTTLQLVPSMLRLLLEEEGFENCQSLKRVFCGGEALPSDLPARFFSRIDAGLYNLYGPTEATIDATCGVCRCGTTNGASVPIGRPIANTQLYVLDDYLRPVPLGIAGELYIGGEGLARGYLNRPGLTADRFVSNPFSDKPGSRLYRTGDLARYLADGNIEFLGRVDDQVKIRGYRIELGEIEAVLGQRPSVRDAVVLAREDNPGDKRLVAYAVPAPGSAPSATELRSFLQQKLPEYMVPSAFMFLESLPLTPNGKLDRKALPAPDQTRPELDQTFAPPRTPFEEQLAGIWAEALKLDKVGIHDNFFDLGGHSLLAVKLIAKLKQDLEVELPLRFLFQCPTIAQLAIHVGHAGIEHFQPLAEQASFSHLVRLQLGHGKTNIFCFSYIGGYAGDLLRFAKLARLVGPEYSFYGLQAKGTDGVSLPHESVHEMVVDYLSEIQAIQPHGPYFLIGECFSGRVAYEAAQQLRAGGERVGLLVLLEGNVAAPSWVRYFWRRLKGPFRYRKDRLRESSAWNYFKVRTTYHLGEIKRLQASQGWRYIFERTASATELIPQLLCAEDSAPFQQGETNNGGMGVSKSKQLNSARKNYWFAVNRYQPRPYDGRVTLIVNEQWYNRNPSLGGNGLATAGVEIHRIPGDHTTYITEHIDIVARQLRECLEKAQGENRPEGRELKSETLLDEEAQRLVVEESTLTSAGERYE